MAGAGIRNGGGIDGDLEIARQGGVEQLHGTDDLADLGGRGPCDEAHDRRCAKAADMAQCVLGAGGVVLEVTGKGAGAEAVADTTVADGGLAVGRRARKPCGGGRRQAAGTELVSELDDGGLPGVRGPGLRQDEIGDRRRGAFPASGSGGASAAASAAGGKGEQCRGGGASARKVLIPVCMAAPVRKGFVL